ncbi:MAG: hypothetical protein FWD32_02380 [Firmicutes bacterium]|nr:hypothetical protein [Bacillota bacterium]
MIIFWAVVVGIALLIEFYSCDMVSTWFGVGGMVAILLAAFEVSILWQVLVFFIVSFTLLLTLRRITKQWLNVKTVPTNADSMVGLKIKLLADAIDGRSEAKVNDVVWTVVVEGDTPTAKGANVEVVRLEGNKLIAKTI